MFLRLDILAALSVMWQLMAQAYGNPLLFREGVSSQATKLINLSAKCDKSGMFITLQFNNPFNGVIYSIGHHGQAECTYVAPANGGHLTYTFLIPVGKCGTEGQYVDPKPGEKVRIRNTIVIQSDPDFITAEDSAHALSCTWSDSYAKSVTTKPIQLENEEPTRVVPVVLNPIDLEGQIHKPHQHNVASGLFQNNKEKNVIISVMDPFNQYDASALDCTALSRDGGNAVALTDKNGCMVQLNLMPPFQKIRNPGVGLTLYSTIKDHKLLEIKDLLIKCNIQVCEKECPSSCLFAPPAKHRSSVNALPLL